MGDFMTKELEDALKTGDVDTVRQIIESGVEVNCWNADGFMPMSLAAWKGHDEVVRLLLSLGADPDERDYEGDTATDYAFMYDHDDVLDTLLEHGDEASKARRRRDVLNKAAHFGDAYTMERLLGRYRDLEELGLAALHTAVAGASGLIPECHAQNNAVVELLLARGVDVNGRQDGEGVTALHIAASYRNKELVPLLRAAGANIGLIEAVMMGELETVQAQLDAGENPNLVCPEGCPAIVYAAERGHTQIVRLLLESGANPWFYGSSPHTAFWMASSEGHQETALALLEAAQSLYPEEEDRARQTIPQERLKALLVGLETDLDACGHFSKQTPLMEAADHNWLLLAEPLLEAGADINYRNDSGFTALMLAAKRGHLEMVQLLLRSGAQYNVKNEQGISILEEAIGGGHTEVEELLRSVGALEGWVRLPDSPEVS